MMQARRAIATVGALLVTLTALAGPVAGHAGEPGSSPSLIAPGVVWTVLGDTWPDAALGYRLELARIDLAPGASVPAHTRPGDELLYVEQGALTVTTLVDQDGPDASVDTGDGPGVIHREMYGAGRTIVAGPTEIQAWQNQGSEATVVLSSALLTGDGLSVTPVVPVPSPTPRPPVTGRVVLTGHGSGGPYRIAIRDRSGHLVGARLPRPAELRFARGGPSLVEGERSATGPIAVLLRWSGTGCGPVVYLDISADLSTIELSDRSPGCDASAMGHWVVLEFDRRARLDETSLKVDERQ